MRVLCCLNHDVVSNIALNLLLPALDGHEVRIGLSERIGGSRVATLDAPARQELRIAEQQLATEVFFPLVERANVPDDGRRFLTFREMERYRGIPVSSLSDPNGPEGLAAIEAFAPDLMLSIRYGAILKAEAISLLRLGVLNLHSGLLPEYRGVLATYRALMRGDAEIGCTLHYISDRTIDTGDILGTARVPVRADRSLLWHVLALYPAGVPLVAAALEGLSCGRVLRSTPQETGIYYSYPTQQEWEAFASRGWRVVDASDLNSIFVRYLPAS